MRLLIGTVAGGTLALALLVPATPARIIGGIVFLVMVAALFLFGSLTVVVRRDEVVAAFGPGWIHRRIPTASIVGARAVRNRWYYGWGVRWTPHGWMFNIDGLEAVELELDDGRRFRIGTDDVAGLVAAIDEARGTTD